MRQNIGSVVSIRGGVVDIRFDHLLPPIHRVLHTGAEGSIVIEVLEQLDSQRVRGIALTPTQGLARGMRVEDSGEALRVPVGKQIISRMFDVFGRANRSVARTQGCGMAQHPARASAAGRAIH